MQKNKKVTLVSIGIILLLLGVIGLYYSYYSVWMDVIVLLGVVGILWGWLEKSKGEENSYFKSPWVRALIAIVIFVLIFLAGAFGGHFVGHNGSIRFQNGRYQGNGTFNGGNRNRMPANGSGNSFQGPGEPNSTPPTNGTTPQ
jgi:ABC-type transport system involved in multi-copper enzyme maturation permease subunit